MSQSLQSYVPPMPGKRPPYVTARNWRLAAIYPRAKSAYEAMVAAGYSPVTALASASRTLASAGVVRARQAQEEMQRDKVAEIAAKSGDAVSDRVATMQDAALVMTWKTAEELKRALPPIEVEARLPRQWYKAQVKRALLRAYKLGMQAAKDRGAEGPADPGLPL